MIWLNNPILHFSFFSEILQFIISTSVYYFCVTLGLRPQPRIWLKWNLSKLEPPHIKMREEIMNQAKNADKKSKLLINDLIYAETSYQVGSNGYLLCPLINKWLKNFVNPSVS